MTAKSSDGYIKRTYQFSARMVALVQAVAQEEGISEAAAMRQLVGLGHLVYRKRFSAAKAVFDLAVEAVAGDDAA
jgi:hypothetical protein